MSTNKICCSNASMLSEKRAYSFNKCFGEFFVSLLLELETIFQGLVFLQLNSIIMNVEHLFQK